MYELKKRYKKVIPSTCLIATTVPIMHLLPVDFMRLKRSSAVGAGGGGGWGGGDMNIAVGWSRSFDHFT